MSNARLDEVLGDGPVIAPSQRPSAKNRCCSHPPYRVLEVLGFGGTDDRAGHCRITAPPSWSSGTAMDTATRPGVDRSSAVPFTSVTTTDTAASMTRCACVRERSASEDPNQDSSDLVIDVAELIWEPIAVPVPSGVRLSPSSDEQRRLPRSVLHGPNLLGSRIARRSSLGAVRGCRQRAEVRVRSPAICPGAMEGIAPGRHCGAIARSLCERGIHRIQVCASSIPAWSVSGLAATNRGLGRPRLLIFPLPRISHGTAEAGWNRGH
jgi:hypothetical protein